MAAIDRPDPLLATFTGVVGRAWFEVCEEPARAHPATWSAEQRATFAAMAEAALFAARDGQGRDALAIARALCFGFWRDDPRPWAFERLPAIRQEAFLKVAQRVIAAGQALRAKTALGTRFSEIRGESAQQADLA